jgi:hypothetical protein
MTYKRANFKTPLQKIQKGGNINFSPPSFQWIHMMLMFIIILLILYVLYLLRTSYFTPENTPSNISIVGPLASISSRSDPMNDPYVPPLKLDLPYFRNDNSDIRGLPAVIPINVPTQGRSSSFSQMGILVRDRTEGAVSSKYYDSNDSLHDNMILPLMGRRTMNGRDKYQYYTTAQNGTTKLPITFKGRNGMNEYGCDEISNSEIVDVQGYNNKFKVTMYENGNNQYIGYI